VNQRQKVKNVSDVVSQDKTITKVKLWSLRCFSSSPFVLLTCRETEISPTPTFKTQVINKKRLPQPVGFVSAQINANDLAKQKVIVTLQF